MAQKVFLKIAFRLLNQPKQNFIDMRYGLSKSGVPPNSVLFGRTVPANSVLFGGTVPPNSFPQCGDVMTMLHMLP